MSDECHGITRRDRDDLAKLVRRREQLAKNTVKQRAAELLADVETQLARQYRSDDARWKTITDAANMAVQAADAQVAAFCREQGIPEQFRPKLNLAWWGRGENACKERRIELRKVAATRIAALEAKAKAEIERWSVETQTQLVAGGLETDAAREFLEALPAADQLMPTLALSELEASVPLPPVRQHE